MMPHTATARPVSLAAPWRDPGAAATDAGRSVLGDWSLDPLFVRDGCCGRRSLYLIGRAPARRPGVRQLAGRRGRSRVRASGLVVIVVATSRDWPQYDRVLFSMHVVQHVLLGMVAPILLVLGAPVTLALQASSRPTQARLLAVLHSRPVRVVTNPVVVWVLFGGTLVVLYFTGLYELSLRNGWVHAGSSTCTSSSWACLFLAFVVGLDPIPGAMSYGARAPVRVRAGAVPRVPRRRPARERPGHRAATGTAVRSARGVAARSTTSGTGAGILWVVGELVRVLALAVVALPVDAGGGAEGRPHRPAARRRAGCGESLPG